MSKTDKTKPWAIRVMEHQPWANHDHRDGICDLPEHFRDNAYYTTESGAGHCRWSDWNVCYDGCCNGCGCRVCSGYYTRRAERRRSRHVTRRQMRALEKGGEW